MAKQKDLDKAYMRCALAMSQLSYAKRKKVGAILVSPQGSIIAEGFNGTPSGDHNVCEITTIEYHPLVYKKYHRAYYCEKCNECFDANTDYGHSDPYHTVVSSVTKPEVLHAESNAIAKVAKSTNSSVGATLYCTLSCCFECAKLIIQAEISRFVYIEEYRDTSGLDRLRKSGVIVDKISLD